VEGLDPLSVLFGTAIGDLSKRLSRVSWTSPPYGCHAAIADGGHLVSDARRRYSDGRPSVSFYWDDLPERRLNPEFTTSWLKALARAERDKTVQVELRSVGNSR
jgi:hypothetical protein